MKNIFSKKSLAFLIAALMILSSIAVIASADTTELDVWNGEIATGYAGGTGTEEDPYLISTPEQLALMVTTSGSETYKKHYKLVKDIYINDVTNPNWQESGPNNWFDIHNDNFFRGIFDGDGHTIYGLYYNGNKADGGLFWGIRGDVVTIKNLVILNACIKVTGDTTTTGNNAAALAGCIYQNTTATIENCYIDETVLVSGRHGVAGFIGGGTCKSISFVNCASFATISTTISGGRLGSFVGNLSHNSGTGDARKITYNNCIGSEIYTNYAQYPTYIASYCAVEGTADSTSGTKTYPQLVALDDMKGEAAKTNMLDLDWTGTWATTDGFPVFKSMLPEAPACTHENTTTTNTATYFKDGMVTVVCDDCDETVSETEASASDVALDEENCKEEFANSNLTITLAYSEALIKDIQNGAVISFNYSIGEYSNSIEIPTGIAAVITLEGFNTDRLNAELTYYLTAEYTGVNTDKLAGDTTRTLTVANDVELDGKTSAFVNALNADGANTVVSTKIDATTHFAENTITADLKEGTMVLNFVASDELVATLGENKAYTRTNKITVTIDGVANTYEFTPNVMRKSTTINISGMSFEQLNGRVTIKVEFIYEAATEKNISDTIVFEGSAAVAATNTPVANAFAAYIAG